MHISNGTGYLVLGEFSNSRIYTVEWGILQWIFNLCGFLGSLPLLFWFRSSLQQHAENNRDFFAKYRQEHYYELYKYGQAVENNNQPSAVEMVTQKETAPIVVGEEKPDDSSRNLIDKGEPAAEVPV
jgi:hypothetical protein